MYQARGTCFDMIATVYPTGPGSVDRCTHISQIGDRPDRWTHIGQIADRGSKIGQIGVPMSARLEFGQIDVPILDQIGRCRISVPIVDQNDLTLSGEQSPNSRRTILECCRTVAELRRTSPNICQTVAELHRTSPSIWQTVANHSLRHFPRSVQRQSVSALPHNEQNGVPGNKFNQHDIAMAARQILR
jgi:hypothetical protein